MFCFSCNSAQIGAESEWRTANSESIKSAVAQLPEKPTLAWVTGAGSAHPLILGLLANTFEEIRNVSERDLNPNTLEAECFAWLAIRHLRGLPITTPETTGCREASCAGVATARGLCE